MSTAEYQGGARSTAFDDQRAWTDHNITGGKHANAIDIAGKSVDQVGAVHYEAERLRLKGVIAYRSDRSAPKEAEGSFRASMEVARSQKARTFELQAAMDLAKLWQEQGDVERGRELLTPIYTGFTEGFDTPALQEAKALIEVLA